MFNEAYNGGKDFFMLCAGFLWSVILWVVVPLILLILVICTAVTIVYAFILVITSIRERLRR